MFPSTSVSISIASKHQTGTRRKGIFFSSLFRSDTNAHITVTNSRESHFVVLEAFKAKNLEDVPSVDLDVSLKIFEFWGLEYEECILLARAYPPILNEDRNRATQIYELLRSYGFDKEQFREMLITCPNLLKRIDLDNLQRAYTFLIETMEMPPDYFVKMVATLPRTLLLDANVFQNFHTHFLETLPLEPLNVAKIIARHPTLLDLSWEANLKPKLDFFLFEIDIPKITFSKRLKQQPNALALSLGTLRERVIWVKKEFNYTDADIRSFCSLSLRFLVLRHPMLLSKIENICKMFGYDRKECGAFLKLYPYLLTLSVQNINETFDFLTQEMKRNVDEIVKNPKILTHSVAKRIRPRYELLHEIRISERDSSLAILYCSTDRNFQKLLRRHGY